jgi:hypothetical protein
MYGDLSHANPKKRRTLKDLMGTPFFPVLQVDFVNVLNAFVVALSEFVSINDEAITQLKAVGLGSPSA